MLKITGCFIKWVNTTDVKPRLLIGSRYGWSNGEWQITVNKVRLFSTSSSVLLVIGTDNQQQHSECWMDKVEYPLSNYQREFRCDIQQNTDVAQLVRAPSL